MPSRVRVVLALAALWVVSPIDLVPEFLAVIGPLDDVVVAAAAVRYAVRHAPREVVTDAWPGSPAMLGRLLGDVAISRRPGSPGAGGGVG